MRQLHSLPAITAVAALMLALTACVGNDPAQTPGEPTATTSPAPTESTSTVPPTESTSTTAPTESASTQPPSPSPSAESQVIKGTGVYVGQIDNHSIEIETEEGPTAFELGAGTESVLEGLSMDDPVVFEYVEKAIEGDASVKQRVISKLSLAK